MSKTAQQAATQIRRNIGDTVETYRWPDSELLEYINSAVEKICAMRPDARMNADGDESTISAISSMSGTIPIRDDFFEAICAYGSMKAFESESDEKSDASRFTMYQNKFKEQVFSV